MALAGREAGHGGSAEVVGVEVGEGEAPSQVGEDGVVGGGLSVGGEDGAGVDLGVVDGGVAERAGLVEETQPPLVLGETPYTIR